VPALRVPEHTAHRLFLLVEQTELAPQTAVVPLLGFLEARQVGFQLLVRAPSRAVDTLEHLVLGITAPVSAGHLHELEGLQLRGAGHMRAAAQVKPRALPIKRDVFARRNGMDDFRLVVLAHALEQGDGLVTRDDAALHFEVRLGQFLHLGLDLLEVFGVERALESEVVVETIVHHRADGDLRRRKKRLHGLSQEVGRGMTDDFERFRALVRDDSELRIRRDEVAGVYQLAIHLAGKGRLGKAGTDGRRHLSDGNGMVEAALAAIRQGNRGHVASWNCVP
jgi:hypothetical protein